MDNCSRLPLYWMLMCLKLYAVLKAQKVDVDPTVTGYLGHDVTLPAMLVRGGEQSISITQVEWKLRPLEEQEEVLIVFNPQYGTDIKKDRVKFANKSIDDFSLIISDVQPADAGLYTCSLSTYPDGVISGTTNLTVRDQPPEYVPSLSEAVVAAIVVVVILLLVVTAAATYLIVIKKRQKALINHNVSIDTRNVGTDAGGAFVKEDLVYSDIQFKSTRRRDNTPSVHSKQTGVAHVDDVTYSEVTVGRHRPDGEDKTIYALVTKI